MACRMALVDPPPLLNAAFGSVAAKNVFAAACGVYSMFAQSGIATVTTTVAAEPFSPPINSVLGEGASGALRVPANWSEPSMYR